MTQIMGDGSIEPRLAFVGLEADESETLLPIRKSVELHLDVALDRFHAAIGNEPHAASHFGGGAAQIGKAAAIEQIASTMEQTLATLKDNATLAAQTEKSVLKVSREVEQAGMVMSDATLAMEDIRASSHQIAAIIGLIDTISFQTNLLALNASVEAARAGEAGKGFAVVAVEVRRLAQSAAEASAQIKALVEKSLGIVERGSGLVTWAQSPKRHVAQPRRRRRSHRPPRACYRPWSRSIKPFARSTR